MVAITLAERFGSGVPAQQRQEKLYLISKLLVALP